MTSERFRYGRCSCLKIWHFPRAPALTCSVYAPIEEYTTSCFNVDTRSCVSPRRLSRISHIFHMTLFDVRLASGSHLSVSGPPEEYRMSGFLGDHCCAICVFHANAAWFDSRYISCFSRGCFWWISALFLREGGDFVSGCKPLEVRHCRLTSVPEVDAGCCSHLEIWTYFPRARVSGIHASDYGDSWKNSCIFLRESGLGVEGDFPSMFSYSALCLVHRTLKLETPFGAADGVIHVEVVRSSSSWHPVLSAVRDWTSGRVKSRSANAWLESAYMKMRQLPYFGYETVDVGS